MRGGVRKLALAALLVTVMLMLGYVESLVPTGVPGIKLGLSNSVLILALVWLGVPWAVGLMLAKVLLSGFLFSGVGAMLYALAGGVLSLAAMCLLYRMKGFSLVTVAIAGAVLHNVGQVCMAMLILKTAGLVYYMGVLMLVGVVTGFVTGTAAKILVKRIPESMLPK
jgi:heptaprenyl diphosphate synthase